jgi:hypothetical protein
LFHKFIFRITFVILFIQGKIDEGWLSVEEENTELIRLQAAAKVTLKNS